MARRSDPTGQGACLRPVSAGRSPDPLLEGDERLREAPSRRRHRAGQSRARRALLGWRTSAGVSAACRGGGGTAAASSASVASGRARRRSTSPARHDQAGATEAPLGGTATSGGGAQLAAAVAPWHFLYFFPLPHGQGSLRPTLAPACLTVCGLASPASAALAAAAES